VQYAGIKKWIVGIKNCARIKKKRNRRPAGETKARTMANGANSTAGINKKRKRPLASQKRADRRNRIKQKFGAKIKDRQVNQAGKCRNG
jgi:hypothetical protein